MLPIFSTFSFLKTEYVLQHLGCWLSFFQAEGRAPKAADAIFGGYCTFFPAGQLLDLLIEYQLKLQAIRIFETNSLLSKPVVGAVKVNAFFTKMFSPKVY